MGGARNSGICPQPGPFFFVRFQPGVLILYLLETTIQLHVTLAWSPALEKLPAVLYATCQLAETSIFMFLFLKILGCNIVIAPPFPCPHPTPIHTAPRVVKRKAMVSTNRGGLLPCQFFPSRSCSHRLT